MTDSHKTGLELGASFNGSINAASLKKRSTKSDSLPSLTGSTTNEKAPLVGTERVFHLNRTLSAPGYPDDESGSPARYLGMIGGVFAPVALAQFSTNVFERVGELINSMTVFIIVFFFFTTQVLCVLLI